MRISDWSSDVCSSDLAIAAWRWSGNPVVASPAATSRRRPAPARRSQARSGGRRKAGQLEIRREVRTHPSTLLLRRGSRRLLRHFAGGVARLGIQAEPAAPAAALFLLGLGLPIHARLVRGCVPLGEREAPPIRAGSISASRFRHPLPDEALRSEAQHTDI